MLMNGEFEAGERDATQWMSVLKLETTDESDVEDGVEVLVVHQLPWFSETVCDLKRALDQQIWMSKTPQAKRQIKKKDLPEMIPLVAFQKNLHLGH